MNIHEAAKSGKPFFNPDMIGAWLIVDGQMVHRDAKEDFVDMAWIKMNCLWDGGRSRDKHDLYWMNVEDLLRDDWEIVE